MSDNDDDLQKKIQIQERIRISQGKFTAGEIAEKCIYLLKSKKFLILDKQFPSADKNEIEEAVYNITSSSKYKLDTTPYHKRWLVKRNPDYRNEFWHDAKIAFIASVFALLAGYILLQIDNRSKNLEQERVIDRLNQVERKLDSLTNK